MNNNRDINSYFDGVINNINIILNNDFYDNKDNLEEVKNKVLEWQEDYKKNNTLKGISVKDLEYLDLEITDFFADYVATEPIKENYAERLSYDFSILEKKWKDEMLGGN